MHPDRSCSATHTFEPRLGQGARLDGFVTVQEAARTALARQLREEATHHQGKHATELGALEEKLRLLTEQLDALKAEAGAATTKEAQQIAAVATQIQPEP